MTSVFYPLSIEGETVEHSTPPPYDGNTIVGDVIYKPNPPTTEEEVAAVKAHEAEQKRLAEAERKKAEASAKVRVAASIVPDRSGKYCKITTTRIVPIECSCVCYARELTGIDVGSIIWAKNHPINSLVPVVGAIVVWKDGGTGHLAGVVSINGDGTITIKEANFSKCAVTIRTIPILGSGIDGYYIK